MDLDRRRWMRAAGAMGALAALGGCATFESPAPWESRLAGDTVALLGEVHDNRDVHRRRAASLRRALEAGWRPAIVMEQFDTDRQEEIERSRRDHPGDAGHLMRLAGRGGWDWKLYEPVIELAFAFDLPLVAGNLPRADAQRLVREPVGAVLGDEQVRRLGLDVPMDPAWAAAQEREINQGHCGALPPSIAPGMVRAQAAKDAQMAQRLKQHASRGAVLIAGNGHVRRDLGVPRWLADVDASRVLAVGFLERGTDTPSGPEQYDAVVFSPRPRRVDPCEALRKRGIKA